MNPNYAPEDSAEALGWVGDDTSAISGISALSTTANTMSTLAYRATCKAMGTGQFLSIRVSCLFRLVKVLPTGPVTDPGRKNRRATADWPSWEATAARRRGNADA